MFMDMAFFVLGDSSMHNAMPTSWDMLRTRSDEMPTHFGGTRTHNHIVDTRLERISNAASGYRDFPDGTRVRIIFSG